MIEIESPKEYQVTAISLTNEQIALLNEWLNYYRNETNDARNTGVFVGIKHTLQHMKIYHDVIYDKRVQKVFVSEETVNYLIEKMNKNSVNALWNLGLASGICWTLELFGLLDSNYSRITPT